ncbi:MAG: TonB family protein [Candidatus Sulfotelmatobacter sp.]
MPETATLEPEKAEPSIPDLRLLVPVEPRSRVFFRNLRDIFRPRELPPLAIESAPAAFWPDVFVHRGLPWSRFFQSAAYHVLALALVWAGSRFLILQPHVVSQTPLTHADVVYYAPSEYLPPLDTRRSNPAPARDADPEYSAQSVISVPPEASNRSQTIVAAPRLQLPHDVAFPNLVALSGDPKLPIAPAPVVPVSQISRLTPQMERSIIAPPPTAERDIQQSAQKTPQAPQPSVIAPPPSLDAASNRRVGELNIGHSAVIAPAPQLSVDAQRTSPGGRSALHARSPEVIAPPPALGASGRSRSGGSVIALNLHPAVGAPPTPPIGNRRGTFAATPEGHRGASGTPGSDGRSNGSGTSKKNGSDLPSGLYVGKTSTSVASVAGDPAPEAPNYVNPKLIANARPPRIWDTQSDGNAKLSEPERAVFGNRKVYSLSLNMPNLNSAGGSWIIRFAALKPDTNQSAHSGEAPPDDLSSPTVTRKVDPAYPLELMRQNLAGTVILYGIIRADGTVHGVRVLRSVDERLDQFASEAIARWQFQPATKNGSAVDVEATFWIPFHPTRAGSAY